MGHLDFILILLVLVLIQSMHLKTTICTDKHLIRERERGEKRKQMAKQNKLKERIAYIIGHNVSVAFFVLFFLFQILYINYINIYT